MRRQREKRRRSSRKVRNGIDTCLCWVADTITTSSRMYVQPSITCAIHSVHQSRAQDLIHEDVDRTKRVKDARSEAQKEIEDYREQKENEFKDYEKQVRCTTSYSGDEDNTHIIP